MTPTMKRTLTIPLDKVNIINHYLNSTDQTANSHISCGITFPDKIVMNIYCFGQDKSNSYTDAFLYQDDKQINHTNDHSTKFIGTWSLLDFKNNTKYELLVIPDQLFEFYSFAYEVYKIDWKHHHINPQIEINNWLNYWNDRTNWTQWCCKTSFNDIPTPYGTVLNEFGYNGQLYACFDEFLDSEFQDESYMHYLLDFKDNKDMETMYHYAIDLINEIKPEYKNL